MTTQEYKREARKQQRQERAAIEKILHPCPVMKGCEICHEHKGRTIIFSAWKGECPAQELGARKTMIYNVADILDNGAGFYRHERHSLEWLTI